MIRYILPLSLFALLSSSCFAETKIVLLAGTPSHGYGAHEHLAGCRVIAEAIENATEDVKCEVIAGGWPEDAKALNDADAIVMYCDGGGRHPAVKHLAELEKLLAKDIGFCCLHYGVEVPKGEPGDKFVQWLGGYFETNWSVNPHWTAEFKSFPKHPATSGVKPFAANDEWYFHMRFQPEMKGVTPLLSAVAPADTMRRKDGPHSGNPFVRKAVAAGKPQHTAWVFTRENGGRSFGFTGGHYHWNWGREDILRLVCNSIVWTAKHPVPKSGLDVFAPPASKLAENQDEKTPKNFDVSAISKKFDLEE